MIYVVVSVNQQGWANTIERLEAFADDVIYQVTKKRSISRRSRIVKELERLSFLGYVAVGLSNVNVWPQLRDIRGVKWILTIGHEVAIVRGDDLSTFRDTSIDHAMTHPLEGKRVEMIEGPFAGHTGIFHAQKVDFWLLGRKISVPVDDLGVIER